MIMKFGMPLFIIIHVCTVIRGIMGLLAYNQSIARDMKVGSTKMG